MADNIFRSYRSRDSVARDDVDTAPRADGGDPLAELARLIGQSDSGGRHDRPGPGRSDRDSATAAVDRAAREDYPAERNRAEQRYAPGSSSRSSSPPSPSSSRHSSYAPYPEDRAYENGPPASGRFSPGPAPRFDGLREPADDDQQAHDEYYRDDQQPVSIIPRSTAFASAESDEGYEDHDEQHEDAQADANEDDPDAAHSRRRNGLVLVMAVLGLMVLGTAGAFAYRAMFGGSVLPSLPPIIKPASGPNKIAPSAADAQTNNSGQPGAPGASATEKLVSHEEQPVNIQEPAKPMPRIVSTIPIAPSQSPPPPASALINAAALNAAPPAVAQPPVAPPPVAPPGPAQMVQPAPPPADTASAAPKKVHTVSIRADQTGGADAASPAPAARPAPRSPAAAKPPRTTTSAGRNEPLSLVPNGQGDAPAPPPAHTRASAAPTSVASATPGSEPESKAGSAGGGYAVQLTSQRSEADAQAAYRALQVKFPNQLGGREPIIRRADLGAKGTFYRALVGPFASAEEAAGMCSGLKAAGGTCLVQRH